MRKKTAVLSVTLVLLALLVFFTAGRLEPTVKRFAEAEFRREISALISSSVNSVIEEEGADYDSLVEVETDGEGNIKGIYMRADKVNLFKNKVTLKLLSALDGEKRSVEIPLGNLSGIFIFTGRGPRIKIKLIGVKSLSGKMESSFSSVGINQTRHTLDFEIRAELTFALMTGGHSFFVTDSLPVADTVIVGKVPDGYTAINKASDELIGDIVDFKAEP